MENRQYRNNTVRNIFTFTENPERIIKVLEVFPQNSPNVTVIEKFFLFKNNGTTIEEIQRKVNNRVVYRNKRVITRANPQ